MFKGQSPYLVKDSSLLILVYIANGIRDLFIMLLELAFNMFMVYKLRQTFKVTYPSVNRLSKIEIKNFKIVIVMSFISIFQHINSFMVSMQIYLFFKIEFNL